MEKKSTHQEILLLTGTRFSGRQHYQEINPGSSDNLSGNERLEEACWNGMLNEMLPEISEKTADGKNLRLWQIRATELFLELELGESPESKEDVFSIDPPCVLSGRCLN
jgi:hypothetical protein